MSDSDTGRTRWSLVVESLTRPYRVTLPMVLLVSLVPLYIFIPPMMLSGRTLYVPELALDRALPVSPVWNVVYGSHLVFILLPVLVVRREEQIRRTVRAYLMLWIVAYVCFLIYPTKALRPEEMLGDGFFAWSLRLTYGADPPYNCFPSIHVAHAFVSAMTCAQVHRGVGIAAGAWASLIALSTLFTKQHYILDVVAGVLLAGVACVLFLRRERREPVSELDRRVAPVMFLGLVGIHALAVAGFWVAYMVLGEP